MTNETLRLHRIESTANESLSTSNEPVAWSVPARFGVRGTRRFHASYRYVDPDRKAPRLSGARRARRCDPRTSRSRRRRGDCRMFRAGRSAPKKRRVAESIEPFRTRSCVTHARRCVLRKEIGERPSGRSNPAFAAHIEAKKFPACSAGLIPRTAKGVSANKPNSIRPIRCRRRGDVTPSASPAPSSRQTPKAPSPSSQPPP